MGNKEDRRRAKRTAVKLAGDKIGQEAKKHIFIKNVSSQGIYILTSPSHMKEEHRKGDYIALKLNLPSEGLVTLYCRIAWITEENLGEETFHHIGMEIINPPQAYRDFVNNLQISATD